MTIPLEDLRPAEAAERRKSNVLRVVRAAFLVLMVTFSLLAALQQQQSAKPLFQSESRWWLPMLVSMVLALILVVAAIALDLATPKKKISAITGVIMGIVAGVLATVALGFIIDLLLESWVQNSQVLEVLKPLANFIKVLVGLTLSYIGVTTVLQTQDDFRLVIPYVEFAKQIRGVRPLLIDTSALIDGRFADVAATGFLQAPLVIPRFVVAELQTLADSSDPMKRAKGRRGLEFTSRLQRTPRLDVTIDESPVPGKAVDQMLVELARTMPAVIVTTDVALSQVAKIAGVAVLNLNDLANSLKSSLIPGEVLTVKLIRAGEQPGQGVGYLPDGAMIVAENGAGRVGQTVELMVTSSLQTSAGRLIFARIPENSLMDAASSFRPGSSPDDAGAPVNAANGLTPAPDTEVARPTSVARDTPADNGASPLTPHSSGDSPDTASAPPLPGNEGNQPRSPFPPPKSFRPTRPGTPRNPRR